MSANAKNNRTVVNVLQDFSIPLIIGVFVAIVFANMNYALYEKLVWTPLQDLPAALSGDAHSDTDHSLDPAGIAASEEINPAPENDAAHGGHHGLNLHFLVNDIFMVLFFGIAAKEITESCLPGGALNPVSKAINPLLGTLGGVLGPVGVYLGLNAWIGEPEWAIGWGIPTATDIALAWLIAKVVFGTGHPAISFLLLLAVADDAIGLGIIAIVYPDPDVPTEWLKALLILPAMFVAYALRKKNVQSWWPYILIGGTISWYGLYSAHLHPALALVFIVPFIPGPKKDIGLFKEASDYDELEAKHHHSPLEQFEHNLKLPVDFGLFFFAFANAGVPFAEVNNLTWIVLGALVFGKTIGITLFSYCGVLAGFPLPDRMQLKHLVVAGLIAGLGLTVALFVAGQAFTVGSGFQGAAKMGALISSGVALAAIALGTALNVRDD